MLQKRLIFFICVMLVAGILLAQGWWDAKPYTAWTKDEVNNMLDKSPWGTVMNRAIERVGHLRSDGATVSGTEAAYDKLAFHISVVTSKPIRMALARRAILADAAAAARTDWGKYIDQENPENIAVAVNLVATPMDSNVALVLSHAMGNYQTADLAAKTFLTTDGGKKVPLAKYDSLGENGYGVKFYFPRNLPDGSSFIAAGNKDLRFDTTLTLPKTDAVELKFIVVTARWDLRKMTYNGKLCF